MIARSLVVGIVIVAMSFASSRPVEAQEAAIVGTVMDSTGGVLPGVTVTAAQTETGNTFVALTDGLGTFRLPVRTGPYRITFELAGFTTVTRAADIYVGQDVGLTVQLMPSTLQETVTVTGDAPLIDTTQSSLGANIDRRQLQELPVNGRSWQDLTLLAPGSRTNAVADAPVDRSIGGTFQLNIDGQQVTQMIVLGGNFGNPKFSRDAIAEFEFVANRFDATQGRSTGVQVNAITKSGTNTFAGSVASYFRDDRFNAADHVVNRVLPYSDQQFSATLGGPIRRDRVHFFANFEYEREPQTFSFTTPYPSFNQDQRGTRREYTGGGRLDVQFSPETRLSVRGNHWENFFPGGTGSGALSSANQTRASTVVSTRWMYQALGSLTQVLNDRAVNELKAGFATYRWVFEAAVKSALFPGMDPQFPEQVKAGFGAPQIQLRGLTIGPANQSVPQVFFQDTYSIRDDLTYSYAARGRHDLKAGGEYLYYPGYNYFCNRCFGVLEANIAQRPDNLEALFPDLRDASTWNLAALSPIAIRWRIGIGNYEIITPRHVTAFWAQDDWALTPRLTLNLGVRYDLQLNAFANSLGILPWLQPDRPNDTNNIAPRLGAVYTLNDRTVIRGGYGQFFGEVPNLAAHFIHAYSQQIFPELLNDGRADFASNPFNGPWPSYEQLQTRVCTAEAPLAPGCIRRELVPSGGFFPESVLSYTHQTSIGVQQQLANTLAVTADYVFSAGRKEPIARNANLTFNPATGANYPFRDVSRRLRPEWGPVLMYGFDGRSNMHAFETAVTKRFSNRWQASGNYTLSWLRDGSDPWHAAFPIAPDLGGSYGLAVTDQRHRAVINGIWEVGGGFQASGLYFFGSGQRFATTWGSDLRDSGIGSENRLRPDGTIVPRNNFVGEPIHRVDLRLQQSVPIGARVKVDGILEIFNVVNHANFGSYFTTENNPATYGQPGLNLNVAYLPRTVQLGFRMRF